MPARKILKSQKGNTATILFLFMLPVLTIYLISSLDHARAVFGTDLDMQQALNDSCRSAALMVNPLSQAHNNPMINPGNAHDAFKDILGSNLKLNEDMTPRANSPITDIEYVLIIYNGENDYGLPEGVKYSPAGHENFSCKLPFTINLSDMGVASGTKIVLDKPGCVATTSTTMVPVLGKNQIEGARWSAAKILR